jgi:hypothetical protein
MAALLVVSVEHRNIPRGYKESETSRDLLHSTAYHAGHLRREARLPVDHAERHWLGPVTLLQPVHVAD